MPKATIHTASPPPGPTMHDTEQSAAPAVPSILALGRMIRASDARSVVADQIGLASKDRRIGIDREMSRLAGRRDALADLAATLPAQSLDEVAVHLAIAFDLIEWVTETETDMTDARAAFQKLRRMVCGAFPIVVGAASMNADDIASEDVLALMAREFSEHVA